MQRFIDRCARALELAIAGFLALMVLLVFGNVVLRYGFNSGIVISEELSRWLFIWLTFMGAVVALREHAHLGTDMLVSRLGRRGKTLCLLISQAGMLYITWLFLAGSWQQAQINWTVRAPVSGLSVALVYLSGVVFSVLAGALVLMQLVQTVRGRVREADLVMVRESEDEAEWQALQSRLAQQEAAQPTVLQGVPRGAA
jgi:TRAP-type C4-dicarboxylate transport system permease small subunit